MGLGFRLDILKRSGLETSLSAAQMKMADELDNLPLRARSMAIVIADDLTGACDAGVQFARFGFSSVVELSSDFESSRSAKPRAADVRIANSRSRHRSPEAAAEEVEKLARRMMADAGATCFKKIDSTLRGQVVAESRAMMRAADREFAVLAPALPSQGRTIVGGMLHVQDCTGSGSADVRSLLSQQDLVNVALLGASGGLLPEQIAREILRLRASGAEFILCDSETEHDLERIAKALAQLPQHPLWVGSAGLAKYAAQILAGDNRPKRAASSANLGAAPAPRAYRRTTPTLFCVGSDHSVTLLQLRRLQESAAAGALDAETATPADVRRIVLEGRHLLLQLRSTRQDRERIGALISEARNAGISAAFLSGGDTAEFVCDAIGGIAIELRDELSPGIPWGVFHGGMLDRLPVATKAGGFGDEKALLRAAESLSSIESRTR